ncbi:MAG TPA: SDR family oxidoreductase [Stackebrandtia sp.]|jgi:nucleoside-diphosphate-sugar epimerase|uniref:SDR family oxidoreductase n=1 Tax=Stackebrandtia sp. TaxID=2023065 RepID=UPI002D58A808|nr:SDR family oxidoreductase [Stackebrandtia sp.]HZE41669.1 SDR family oxidoreductase [Stackebrandtia sp.]
MRIFITGATGWIGTAVTDELLKAGHHITGLARNDTSAATLKAKGATPHPGSLDQPDTLATAAAQADAVIHLAFNHDFTNYAAAGHTEHHAITAMLDALAGTGRPFLFASGLAASDNGTPLTEDDPSPHHGADSLRGGAENLAQTYVDKGVRAIALRFAPTVHGTGDKGFTSVLTTIAQQHATAAYIGDGTNQWAAVHRTDAAHLVHLALDNAPAGARVHAVAEDGIPTKDIAAAIGQSLGVPTTSIPPDKAEEHFGWMGRLFAADIAASHAATSRLLGWKPTGPTLFDDISAGAYVPGAR